MRAYKAFARFRGGDGKAWFMTILRNVCYTMIKKVRSHEVPEPFDEEIHQSMNEPEMQDAIRQKANAESLHQALEKLPEEFREMIVLHDLEGLAYKEIADVVGIPIGNRHVAAGPGAGTIARRDRRGRGKGVPSHEPRRSRKTPRCVPGWRARPEHLP